MSILGAYFQASVIEISLQSITFSINISISSSSSSLISGDGKLSESTALSYYTTESLIDEELDSV